MLLAVVATAPAPTGAAASDDVRAFGAATFHGSTGGVALRAPLVSMAATPSGKGYWLLGGDGGVFSYGDARFHGSTGALALNQPVVDFTPDPRGRGYWLVAR